MDVLVMSYSWDNERRVFPSDNPMSMDIIHRSFAKSISWGWAWLASMSWSSGELKSTSMRFIITRMPDGSSRHTEVR